MRQHWNLEGLGLFNLHASGRINFNEPAARRRAFAVLQLALVRQAKKAVAKKAADGAAQVPTWGRAISTLAW